MQVIKYRHKVPCGPFGHRLPGGPFTHKVPGRPMDKKFPVAFWTNIYGIVVWFQVGLLGSMLPFRHNTPADLLDINFQNIEHLLLPLSFQLSFTALLYIIV